MAADAVAHVQVTHLRYLAHMADVTMASLASKASVDVSLVQETHVIGQAMHSLPVDRLRLLPGGADLIQRFLRLGRAQSLSGHRRLRDHLMAEHALLHFGITRGGADGRGSMAESAFQPRGLDVHAVIEVNRLLRSRVGN